MTDVSDVVLEQYQIRGVRIVPGYYAGVHGTAELMEYLRASLRVAHTVRYHYPLGTMLRARPVVVRRYEHELKFSNLLLLLLLLILVFFVEGFFH